MNPLNAFLKIADIGVGIGAGAVVTNLVKSTTPAGTNPLMKVAVGIGSMVISNMVGDAASKFVKRNVEELSDELKKAKSDIDEAKEANN